MPRIRIGRAFVAALILMHTTRCNGGLSPDELYCEQAAAYLQQCCPGFDPTALNCNYSACSNALTELPALSLDESKCIVNETCSRLVESGVCTRVPMDLEGPSDGSSRRVCP